jgi:hypothetical protein
MPNQLALGSSGRFTIEGIDVDVADVIPGVAATSLGKAEDAAHTSGDVGVMALAVREATATDLSAGNTDGDYEPLQVDASGRLWVNAGAVGTVTPGTAASSLGKAEDAAHTSADVGVMALAVRAAAAVDRSAGNTDGDYEPLAVDALGKLWITGSYAEDAAHTDADVGVAVLGRRIDTLASSAATTGDYATFNLDAIGNLYARTMGTYGSFHATTTVDTNIYSANEIVGGILTFANWAKVTGGGAKLRGLSLWTEDGEVFEATVAFFNATPSGGTYADQGAATWDPADFAKFLGKVTVASANYAALGGDGVATVSCDLPLPVAGTSLFALVFATATPTFAAATDLNITLLAEY